MSEDFKNSTMTSSGAERVDDLTTEEIQEMNQGANNPFVEIGSTGLKRASGILDEETLPALRGRNAVKVYREMSQNDPIVGAMLFAIEKLIRNVDWNVEAASNSDEDQHAKEFVEQNMDDMSHSWGDFISEALSMLPYGWSLHEVVYKRRVGPYETDPRRKSKYTDGMVGWRKMPIRSQETLFRWIFQEDGGIQGMIQMPPPLYSKRTIPMERALLFRTGSHKGNPEGYSVLRNSYRPWYIKKRLEEFEAIGVERDLAGLPVAWVPESIMNADPNSKEFKMYQSFKKMVQNIRRDAHDGLVLPLGYKNDTSNEKYRFELMSSGGSRQFDTDSLIQRYEQRILMSCMADFILLGHEGQGSYAMHTDKTGIFRTAINTYAEAIADVLNRYAIPKLFKLNQWFPQELPRIVPANVDPPDLAQLASMMTSMSGLGMQFFPDPDLEDYVRKISQLPDLPEEMQEMRRQQAVAQNHADLMQTHLQAESSTQQSQMVAEGMTPEQAEQAAAQPTQDMQMNEHAGGAIAQAKGEALAAQDPDVQAHQQQQQEQELNNQMAQQQVQQQGALEQAQAQGDQQLSQEREKTAQGMESQRAQAEQDTKKEMLGRQLDEKSKVDEDKRSEKSKDKDHQRQMQMERLKAKLAAENAKKQPKEAKDKPKPVKKSVTDTKLDIFRRY